MSTSLPTATQSHSRLEIVQSSEALAAIGPAWTRLWIESGALVFQSHAWVSAWWNTLPPRHRVKLRIGVIWQGDQLMAVLPLAIARRKALRFLEWAAINCTDYPDVLVASDCPPEKLHELWKVVASKGGYDIAQVTRLLPDAKARAVVAPTRPGALSMHPGHRSEISYRVVGDYSGEGGWLAKQSKKTRQNYRRGRKLLEDKARLDFRLLDPTTTPLGPVVERFEQLKRKWLSDTDRKSELLEANTGSVAALVGVLKQLGILRIFVLERNGEMVAISINFEQHGAMMALLTTFDPAHEKASPGAVLIMEYIQWSTSRGLRIVDFLCGGEAFKLRYATDAVALDSMVAARTALGHAALFANRIRLRFAPAPPGAGNRDHPDSHPTGPDGLAVPAH